jgi:hypothetical protein
MKTAVLLPFVYLVASASEPLDCFTEDPESAGEPNVCFGAYSVKTHTDTAEECAVKCLADPKCDQFVKATATYSDPNACRLAYTCPQPTSFLAGFDGFLRKTTPECLKPGPSPAPAMPTPAPGPPVSFRFHTPLFANGMILQRDAPTKVWGDGAAAGAKVTVTVGDSTNLLGFVTSTAGVSGNWTVTLPKTPATKSTTMKATDGTSTIALKDVAFGDVILCGEVPLVRTEPLVLWPALEPLTCPDFHLRPRDSHSRWPV